MRFFFYGTLIDPDVRRLVLGTMAPATVEPAVLAGWKRVPLSGVTYPAILRDVRAAVDGVLARGLDGEGRRRLIAYEGDDYDLIDVDVTLPSGRQAAALTFVGRPGQLPGIGVWTLEAWQRRHKRRFVAALVRRRPAR